MGAIKLKRLQVAAWRDELIRIYEDIKDLHHKYMDSLPDITDPQRQACEKWEHNIIAEEVYSVRANQTSQINQPVGLSGNIQKQMLELEVKLEQSKIQMEANATSVTETLSKALKGMGERIGKLIDSSHVTSTEIAANNQLVEDSRKTLHDIDRIKTVKLDLNAQIKGLRTDTGVSKVHLRTIQEQVIDQGARILSRP
ncbi:hypothetical protein OUZ56_029784 [Daphnia magna]|uniref:Uncharacterized protein n=1 Tax=Daphnia magna TaxID=35525 RepID=A0ABR0B7U2_9CRUS|nr:hypothetical protein OUZ56_029784 [Daphnia magna]